MLAIVAESALRSLLLGGAVWIGLHLLRVRNPHVQMTAWVMVLLASLSMPLLMHWTTVTITAAPVTGPGAGQSVARSDPVPGATARVAAFGSRRSRRLGHSSRRECRIRQLVGGRDGILCRRRRHAVAAIGRRHPPDVASRQRRDADPRTWAANADVRVSDAIGGPVTFGSTILLPPQCIDWDLPKRRAVLAHEGAHVANGDFYVLLLASLNRAVFWFSPFAWWHLIRLAELAEVISDARAIEVLDDRAVLRRNSARSHAACPAGAGWAGHGKGMHGACPRRAHSRRSRGCLRSWGGGNGSGPRPS